MYALVAQPVEHLTFNQRARDSSSLERTKIPRRIVRFLVGFSFFWRPAHLCTLFAHRRESRVFLCIVCILCIVSRACRGEAPPSCCARPFCRLKAPLGLSLLRCAAQTRTCRGEAPPSCWRKTALSLKSPTGAFIAALRKRELLRTGHFRQGAKRTFQSFSKKIEKRRPLIILTNIQGVGTHKSSTPLPWERLARRCFL